MKKIIIIFLILIAVAAGIAVYFFLRPEPLPTVEEMKTRGMAYIERELIDSNGLLETYPYRLKKIPHQKDFFREALSESLGIWMWILELEGKQENFNRQTEVLQKFFLLNNDTVSWRVTVQETGVDPAAQHSAPIDDLRIIRVLLNAFKQWEDPEYQYLALKIALALKKTAVYKKYLLEQSMLETDKGSPKIVDLSYLDLETLYKLSELHPAWAPIYERALKILEEGRRENGFFYDKYDVGKKLYYDQDKNFINQLLCAIHLSERGIPSHELMNFLELEIKKHGKIAGNYDPETEKQLADYENGAVYGLAARLALLEGRPELADQLINRIRDLGVRNTKSEWYGALAGKGSHSFDNLLSLLAIILSERGSHD